MIIPLIKNSHGDVSASDNYWGIMLSPVLRTSVNRNHFSNGIELFNGVNFLKLRLIV